MSRNLGRTNCAFCGGEVVGGEGCRPVTIDETGEHYFPEYKGMQVCRATCVDCHAPYLAWVYPPSHWGRAGHYELRGRSCFDLSHYHSFNDEPADADMPKWTITKVVVLLRVPYVEGATMTTREVRTWDAE